MDRTIAQTDSFFYASIYDSFVIGYQPLLLLSANIPDKSNHITLIIKRKPKRTITFIDIFHILLILSNRIYPKILWNVLISFVLKSCILVGLIINVTYYLALYHCRADALQ